MKQWSFFAKTTECIAKSHILAVCSYQYCCFYPLGLSINVRVVPESINVEFILISVAHVLLVPKQTVISLD